jgi:outer membrane protein assembly factor BamB
MTYPAPRALVRVACILSATLVGALGLSGCGMFSWFGGEKDPAPPTPLVAFSPQVGLTTVWSTKVGTGTRKRQLALVPALNGGRLFVADTDGGVAAVSAADGRVLWQRNTKLPFSGGPGTDGRQLALGTTNGQVVALSTADGSQAWSAPVGSEVLSVPLIVGDLVVVHTLDDSVYGLDAATGKERWRYVFAAPILTLRGSSSPVPTSGGAVSGATPPGGTTGAVGGAVLVGLSGGKLVKLELSNGVPIWEVTVSLPSGRTELERIADIDADPVVVGSTAYVGAYNGDLAAVDLVTGDILWRRTLSSHAGLAVDASDIYVTDSEDNIWAADPQDGAGRWKQEQLRNRLLTAPVIFGNYLVVGDFEGWLHLIDRKDGALAGRIKVAGGAITARPLVANGRLYVYADDGTLAAVTTGGVTAAQRAEGGSGSGAAVAAPDLPTPQNQGGGASL